ncbi:MAG: MFS transporter [Actinomycetales bacterium]
MESVVTPAEPLPGPIRLRIGVNFVQRLVDSMTLAFMAIHLAGLFGVAVAGLITTAVMVVATVGTVVGGSAAQRWGRRRPLLAAEALVAVSFLAMSFADASRHGALVLAVGYAASKFGAGLAVPANEAMLVDLSTPQNRTRMYTINYWAINLAIAIGALAGAYLFGLHFQWVLAGAALLMGLVLCTTLIFIPETAPTGTSADTPGRPRASYRRALANRPFIYLALAATLLMTVEFQLVNWIAVHLAQDFGPQNLIALGSRTVTVDGVELLGVLRAENTVLVVVGAFVVGRLLARVPLGVRMITGATLFVAGYVGLALGGSIWFLIGAVVVFTIGELTEAPSRQVLLAELVPEDDRPRHLAVYALHIRIALVLAGLSLTAGAFVGPRVMAAGFALLGAAVLLLYRAVLSGRNRRSPGRPRHRAHRRTRVSGSVDATRRGSTEPADRVDPAPNGSRPEDAHRAGDRVSTAGGQQQDGVERAGAGEHAASPEHRSGSPAPSAPAANTAPAQTVSIEIHRPGDNELAELRSILDGIDDSLMLTLDARIRCCVQIASVKSRYGIAMMQPHRIGFVHRRADDFAGNHDVDARFLHRLYDLLIAETCRVEDELMSTTNPVTPPRVPSSREPVSTP